MAHSFVAPLKQELLHRRTTTRSSLEAPAVPVGLGLRTTKGDSAGVRSGGIG
jgi:hypothetical protein